MVGSRGFFSFFFSAVSPSPSSRPVPVLLLLTALLLALSTSDSFRLSPMSSSLTPSHSVSVLRRSLRLLARSFSSTGETVLSFKNVSFEYAPMKPVLNAASFNIKQGSKVTIMGQNGAGKSTILKLMNGHLKPSQGAINIKNGFALSQAMQVIRPEDRTRTLLDFFLHHLHGTRAGIDGRIAQVLQKVQLQATHDRIVQSFSGGQQARLLLASALILEPDILLLDEPTNNLDVKGIELLRSIIKETDKTCVVISHDEDFLNSFTDSVLYLDNHTKKVEYYDGDYNLVKREISNRIERENAENARLAREAVQKKAQANVFANKGGGMRKVAKKLKEEAAELESGKITVRKEDKALKPFKIPYQQDTPGTRIGVKLLTINSIQMPSGQVADYSLTPILIQKGYKLQLKGPNGVGKTTFLEALVNGEAHGVDINPQATIGYYRQDFYNLNFDSSVLDELHKASGGRHSEQEVRATAASFLLHKELMKQPIRTLSEGQKGLVSLACLVLQEPAILIMDEPTNHINFRHLPAIAEALNNYEGAVLIVSHDNDFLSHMKVDQVIDLADHL